MAALKLLPGLQGCPCSPALVLQGRWAEGEPYRESFKQGLMAQDEVTSGKGRSAEATAWLAGLSLQSGCGAARQMGGGRALQGIFQAGFNGTR